jgi:DNA replication protein DnaC
MPKFNEINEKTSEQMTEIELYAKNPRGFFFITGPNGTGKSFVAEAIYEMHTPYKLPAYDHERAYFSTQADLNDEWLNHFGATRELSNVLKKTKLLVLDDLGTRSPTAGFLDFLYAVIDARWRLRSDVGTIITTNMNSTKTRNDFGDALTSRICSGVILRIDGKDRRFKDF